VQSNAHLTQYNSLVENAKKSVNNSVKMKIHPKSSNFKRPKSWFANEIEDPHENDI
jgi:hypothetical protein